MRTVIINKSLLVTGEDIFVTPLDISIKQPTLKDIFISSEEDFFYFLNLFTIDKEKILKNEEENPELKNIQNFDLFLALLYQDVDRAYSGLCNFFSLLLPDCKLVELNENGFIFSIGEGKVLILNRLNFDTFREVLIEMFFMGETNSKKKDYNPQGDRAKEIAKKLQAAKEKTAKKGVDNSPTLVDYITILVVGLNSYTLEQILNLTLYQMFLLMERFSLHHHFDIDLRCRLAGSTSEEELDNWMKKMVK